MQYETHIQPAPSESASSARAKRPWNLRWLAIAAVLFCFAALGACEAESEPESGSTTTDGAETESVPPQNEQNTTEREATEEPPETSELANEPDTTEPSPPPQESDTDYFGSQFAVFDAVTESGTGDSVISLPAAQGIITASHSGSANFVLSILDEGNAMSELPVNVIGSYDGTTAYGMTGLGGTAASLEIIADGTWDVTIAPIVDAPELSDTEESQGDGVYRYTGGSATWHLTHNGAANFIVTYVSASLFGWEVLVNEIGSYDGTVAVTSGPAVVIVIADGDWSIGSS